jgi:hypothetical protein
MTNETRYGMVLAKDKSEEEAMKWLIRSVHLYPMNWGCWLEMTSLIGQVDDVGLSFHASRTFANATAAQPDITTPTTKHSIFHLPSPHLTRTLSIVAQPLKLTRSTALHLPDQPVSPDMPRSFRLPYERLRHS